MRENEQELRQRIGDLAYDVTKMLRPSIPLPGSTMNFLKKEFTLMS